MQQEKEYKEIHRDADSNAGDSDSMMVLISKIMVMTVMIRTSLNMQKYTCSVDYQQMCSYPTQ